MMSLAWDPGVSTAYLFLRICSRSTWTGEHAGLLAGSVAES